MFGDCCSVLQLWVFRSVFNISSSCGWLCFLLDGRLSLLDVLLFERRVRYIFHFAVGTFGMTTMSFRSVSEESRVIAVLVGDSSLHAVPFRMTIPFEEKAVMTIMSFRARAIARRGIP